MQQLRNWLPEFLQRQHWSLLMLFVCGSGSLDFIAHRLADLVIVISYVTMILIARLALGKSHFQKCFKKFLTPFVGRVSMSDLVASHRFWSGLSYPPSAHTSLTVCVKVLHPERDRKDCVLMKGHPHLKTVQIHE